MKGEVIYPLLCFNMDYQKSDDVAIMVFVLFTRVGVVLGVGLWGDRQTRGTKPDCPLFLGPRPDLDLD